MLVKRSSSLSTLFLKTQLVTSACPLISSLGKLLPLENTEYRFGEFFKLFRGIRKEAGDRDGAWHRQGLQSDWSLPWICKQSMVELPRDVAELSSSPLLPRRSPPVLEEVPRLNKRVTASGVVTLSITQSGIFVSDTCILCD